MGPFRIFSRAHPATITHDKAKISKERLVARIQNIKNSLESNKTRKQKLSRYKKNKLKQEVKSILLELDAREETIDKIIERLEM